MKAEIFIYAGAAMPFVWGVAHLFPTKSIVRAFCDISTDNRNIIVMEWIIEGVALIFIGVLVTIATVLDPRSIISTSVYLSSSACLIVFAFVSLFTGFKIGFLPFRICPIIFTSSAILIMFGWSVIN